MVQAKNKKTAATILITRFSAVGDIAMTIPLLYSLADEYPTHRFVFVSRSRFADFFIDKPRNLEFRGVDLNSYKGLPGLFRLWMELKKEYAPDAFADLHDVLRTKIVRLLFAASGTKTARIIKGRSDRKRLTSGKAKDKKPLQSTFERYRDVFTRIGLPFTPKFKSLFHNGKGDISEFASLLPQKEGCKWVGIAPFARHEGKIYPLHLMRKVVERLAQNPDIHIFCFGNGDKEKAATDEWRTGRPNVHSFIGITDFNGELRLISHLDLMVSMDSANMHMASLAGTPVVSIWGATSPLAGFLGWGQNEADCIQLPLDCRPCSIFGNKPCRFGDRRCMNIPPETVAQKILDKLSQEQHA